MLIEVGAAAEDAAAGFAHVLLAAGDGDGRAAAWLRRRRRAGGSDECASNNGRQGCVQQRDSQPNKKPKKKEVRKPNVKAHDGCGCQGGQADAERHAPSGPASWWQSRGRPRLRCAGGSVRRGAQRLRRRECAEAPWRAARTRGRQTCDMRRRRTKKNGGMHRMRGSSNGLAAQGTPKRRRGVAEAVRRSCSRHCGAAGAQGATREKKRAQSINPTKAETGGGPAGRERHRLCAWSDTACARRGAGKRARSSSAHRGVGRVECRALRRQLDAVAEDGGGDALGAGAAHRRVGAGGRLGRRRAHV
jgi:hypothetical protein